MFKFAETIGSLAFVIFLVLTVVSLIKKNGKVKNNLKGVLAAIIVVIMASFLTPEVSSSEGTNKKVATNSSVATESSKAKVSSKDAENKSEGNKIMVKTSSKSKNEAIGNIKIHYINVGQADSILIQQGSHSMLIDGGNNEDGSLVKDYLQNNGVSNLEFLVGTHPHEDHIGGLDYIINSLKVGKVYLPKITSNTKTFKDLINAMKNKNLKAIAPKGGESFKLGQAVCTILAPNSSQYKDLNNYSIVIKVQFGNNSFLFTGDAEAVSEMEIVKKGFNLKSDVLKVGHHGSSSSTCANFLSKVNPKYAIISCGVNNKYGHPHKGTMNRLKDKGIPVYRTDQCGTIVASSDGNNISFSTKPGNYNFSGEGEKASSNTKSTVSSSNSNSKKTVITKKPAAKVNKQATTTKAANTGSVWLSATGSKYHSIPNCGRVNPKKARKVTLEEAKAQGYEPCSQCNPPQ
ncbi:ComEC/Rec2 family competence protein [Haloimpatiens sp. FM7315]|uniref:ComEC/Rec2 family competence protein n=1 Tax=Haloimpatiens sp. FM7315 TaxID=3298609 RepID=UPI0035A3341C